MKHMKYYYVEITDCQNNVQAIVKVWASSESAAETKALRALHRDDKIYVLNKEEALYETSQGHIIIDEDGDEADII